MTCKQYILEVLKEYPVDGLAGGKLEILVHDRSIHKASTVARMANRLYNEGLVSKKYINGFVYYRIK